MNMVSVFQKTSTSSPVDSSNVFKINEKGDGKKTDKGVEIWDKRDGEKWVGGGSCNKIINDINLYLRREREEKSFFKKGETIIIHTRSLA